MRSVSQNTAVSNICPPNPSVAIFGDYFDNLTNQQRAMLLRASDMHPDLCDCLWSEFSLDQKVRLRGGRQYVIRFGRNLQGATRA